MNEPPAPRRRELLQRGLASLAMTALPATTAFADASSAALASYYERHMALIDGTAFGWTGRGTPLPLLRSVRQVGVGKNAWFALRDDGTLLRWRERAEQATVLMRDVARFAAGESGWFAIDRAGALWHDSAGAPVRIAQSVVDACIGDGADYYVGADGALFVKGLAHRGQYGDGLLEATDAFVATARDALAVRAHTGHALYLRRDGVVLGTGGNRFGPLSSHGLGDKADRWGPIFDGAASIATGSRHSLAIRADGSLWAWGEGFAIEPRSIMQRASAVAAGDSATIVRSADGTLWQWDGGAGPRRLRPAG
jgi:alpha-tubulin suppressor-like RCC1 family protein